MEFCYCWCSPVVTEPLGPLGYSEDKVLAKGGWTNACNVRGRCTVRGSL